MACGHEQGAVRLIRSGYGKEVPPVLRSVSRGLAWSACCLAYCRMPSDAVRVLHGKERSAARAASTRRAGAQDAHESRLKEPQQTDVRPRRAGAEAEFPTRGDSRENAFLARLHANGEGTGRDRRDAS